MKIDDSWDLRLAIQKQVEREDTLGWALREEYQPKEEVLKKELPTGKWRAPAEFVFTGFMRKIMP